MHRGHSIRGGPSCGPVHSTMNWQPGVGQVCRCGLTAAACSAARWSILAKASALNSSRSWLCDICVKAQHCHWLREGRAIPGGPGRDQGEGAG